MALPVVFAKRFLAGLGCVAAIGALMELPARIAKYELQEFLGGGMSHVYRAKDTVLGRTVAVKILTPAGVADTDTNARFLQEARTASNISHDNILAVYDFGEEDGKPYMVMEFLRRVDAQRRHRSGLHRRPACTAANCAQ